jgi:hypothetical protein
MSGNVNIQKYCLTTIRVCSILTVYLSSEESACFL